MSKRKLSQLLLAKFFIIDFFYNKNNDGLPITSRGNKYHFCPILNMNTFEIYCVLVIGGINLEPFPRVTLLNNRSHASPIILSIRQCKFYTFWSSELQNELILKKEVLKSVISFILYGIFLWSIAHFLNNC